MKFRRNFDRKLVYRGTMVDHYCHRKVPYHTTFINSIKKNLIQLIKFNYRVECVIECRACVYHYALGANE